jgi:hypothetical protein
VEPGAKLRGQVGQRPDRIDRTRVHRPCRGHDRDRHDTGGTVHLEPATQLLELDPPAFVDRHRDDRRAAQAQHRGGSDYDVVYLAACVDPRLPLGQAEACRIHTEPLKGVLSGGPECDQVGRGAAGRERALPRRRDPQECREPAQGDGFQVVEGLNPPALRAGHRRRQARRRAGRRRPCRHPPAETGCAVAQTVGNDNIGQTIKHVVQPDPPRR